MAGKTGNKGKAGWFCSLGDLTALNNCIQVDISPYDVETPKVRGRGKANLDVSTSRPAHTLLPWDGLNGSTVTRVAAAIR